MSGSLRSALVCSVEDLAVGSVRAVQVDGLAIAVVRTSDGAVHAVRDQCTHGRVALSEGEVDGDTLECCLHGSRFDLRTGVPVNLPATVGVRVYPVDVRDGNVYVMLERGDRQ